MQEDGINAEHKRRFKITTDSKHKLSIVLDLFNREVVGWSLKPHMSADIVTDALTKAGFRRKPAAGLMQHSDRASQYQRAFQANLKKCGMISSMSRNGNNWDNAPSESWFGSFKKETGVCRTFRDSGRNDGNEV